MSHKRVTRITIWKTDTPADRVTELVQRDEVWGDEQDYETVNRAVARLYGDDGAHMGHWLTAAGNIGIAATDYNPETETLTWLDQITVRRRSD